MWDCSLSHWVSSCAGYWARNKHPVWCVWSILLEQRVRCEPHSSRLLSHTDHAYCHVLLWTIVLLLHIVIAKWPLVNGKQKPYWPPYFHSQFVVTVDLNGCHLFYSAANYKAHISLHVTEPSTWQELQLELTVAFHACFGNWVRCLHVSLNHG